MLSKGQHFFVCCLFIYFICTFFTGKYLKKTKIEIDARDSFFHLLYIFVENEKYCPMYGRSCFRCIFKKKVNRESCTMSGITIKLAFLQFNVKNNFHAHVESFIISVNCFLGESCVYNI